MGKVKKQDDVPPRRAEPTGARSAAHSLSTDHTDHNADHRLPQRDHRPARHRAPLRQDLQVGCPPADQGERRADPAVRPGHHGRPRPVRRRRQPRPRLRIRRQARGRPRLLLLRLLQRRREALPRRPRSRRRHLRPGSVRPGRQRPLLRRHLLASRGAARQRPSGPRGCRPGDPRRGPGVPGLLGQVHRGHLGLVPPGRRLRRPRGPARR